MNWYKLAQRLSPEEIDMYAENPSEVVSKNRDLKNWMRSKGREYEDAIDKEDLVQKGNFEVLLDDEYDPYWWERWYSRYAGHMEKGGKEPGSYEGIYYYLKNPDTIVFRSGKTAIWGKEYNGIFLPSHVSPDSNMNLYALIKHVSARQPVVFAVTPEIGSQLSRIGFKQRKDLSFPHYKGGMKEVWANSSAWSMISGIEPEKILEMLLG